MYPIFTYSIVAVRFKLKQFTSELEQLLKNLTDSSNLGRVTVQEAERRQRQIEVLQSKLIHLQTQFTNAPNESSREQLFRTSPYVGNSIWEDDDDDVEPIHSSNRQSVQDLRKQQTQILDDQNEGLEALSKVISRQKDLALRIGDEVDVQNGKRSRIKTTLYRNVVIHTFCCCCFFFHKCRYSGWSGCCHGKHRFQSEQWDQIHWNRDAEWFDQRVLVYHHRPICCNSNCYSVIIHFYA